MSPWRLVFARGEQEVLTSGPVGSGGDRDGYREPAHLDGLAARIGVTVLPASLAT